MVEKVPGVVFMQTPQDFQRRANRDERAKRSAFCEAGSGLFWRGACLSENLDGQWVSFSRDYKRHDGKQTKHHDVYRSRHRVAACQVLSNRQASNPKDQAEFREE